MNTIYTHDEIRQHRQEWLSALRSGQYGQTVGRLFDGDNSYCCLGVACDLADLEKWTNEVDYTYFGSETYGRDYLVLPPEGMVWLGVNSDNPVLDLPDLPMQGTEEEYVEGEYIGDIDKDVATLNDSGLTFAQIADLVEYFGFDSSQDVLQGAEAWELFERETV